MRHFRVRLGTIAAGAMAVRVAFTLTGGFDPTGRLSDSLNYHLLGRGLAAGEGYIRAFDRIQGRTIPTAEFPPAFPSLLAVLDLLHLRSIESQELALAVLGTVTVVLIGLVGRELAGPRVGLIAAGIAAVYPMLFLPDATLQAEGLMAALVSLVLLLSLRARRGASIRLLLGLGVVVGVAALTRSEGLLLLLFVVAAALRAPKQVLVVALPALAIVGAWTVRNTVRLDHFVLLSNNSGTLVAGANCPGSWFGEEKGLWLFSCTTAIDAEGLDETERTHRYQREGLSYARDNLGRLPRIVVVRELRLFGLWSPGNQLGWEAGEGRNRTALTVGWVIYLVVAAAAVAGAAIASRRRLGVLPFLGCVVLVAVLAAVTYGNQRFRISAEPALIVLAAVALDAALSSLSARRSRGPTPVTTAA